MTRKIIKYEIVGLLILSLANLYYFFFANSLPDNALFISDKTGDFSYFSYVLSSVVAYISYYVGPWIVIPLFLVLFFYAMTFSKRRIHTDAFAPVSIVAFFLFFSLVAFPFLVGDGLIDAVDYLLTSYTVFLCLIFFGFCSVYFVLSDNFTATLKKAQSALEELGIVIIKKVAVVYKKVQAKRERRKLVAEPATRTESAQQFMRPKKSAAPEVKVEEVHSPAAVKKDPVPKESDSAATEEAPTPMTVKPTATKGAVPFYDPADLINCISSNNGNNVEGPKESYFLGIMKAIEEKLAEFKISAKIINVLKGPVVDTFELDLGEGVKLSKILGVSDDIGLALNGVPIRIVYPLKGKTTIGIEVPRNPREYIYLDEVLKSKVFNNSQFRLPVAMGKDAYGNTKVVDLAGMPHMLVAGATGAGKSVFINALLTSLIIKKSPKELKLILIDPKQLELATFQDLPHLMLPVITDPKSSAIALLWLVQEMENRYTILKDTGVKNIEGFNDKIKRVKEETLNKISMNIEGVDRNYQMPYIVCVIDEFADLILSKMGKEIETNVNRLAAKARAAGIHMVVATQRPSTDVVTGVIKANFPTRVAFRVTTGHDSKTILDQYGAQKLLGRGDMLYKHGVELLRLHSSFVDEEEIEGLVEKLASIPQEYDENALEFLETGGEDIDHEAPGEVKNYVTGTTDDPVYDEAVQVVMEKGNASASMLQRSLRVGYNRAANIIDELEKNGVVGPAQGSKPRKAIHRE